MVDTKIHMKIYLTSDHGGFELKGKLKGFLEAAGYEVQDLGPFSLDAADDYPDFAKKLTNTLRADAQGMGIAICRSAQGMGMAVNRVKGVRGAIAWNEEEAKKSREHNDANVLCLSADHIDDATNEAIVKTWLETPFSGDERHVRRIKKIDQLS